MRIKPTNLCRLVLTMPSETRQTKAVHLDFECCKNGYPVRACLYFKPMKGAGGVAYPGECQHFNNCQCTCGEARSAAQRWAEAILKAWMA